MFREVKSAIFGPKRQRARGWASFL